MRIRILGRPLNGKLTKRGTHWASKDRELKRRRGNSMNTLIGSKVLKTPWFLSVPDPEVYEHPGSGAGSDSRMYGSGSFHHQAKIVRKTFIYTVL